MEKQFYSSDSMLFTYNTIESTTINSTIPHFSRKFKFVTARPEVTAKDILEEVQRLEDRLELGHFVMDHQFLLTTTLTEYEEFVIALTYKGFVNLAEEFKSMMTDSLKRERYGAVADDLLRNRDIERQKGN